MPMPWRGPEIALLATALLAACTGPPGPSADAAAVAAIERQTLTVAGQPLSALVAGPPAARPLLLIHGTPGSADGWADFLLDPPPGFRVVAVDRPGFGASGPERAVPSLAAQAAAIAAWVPERANAVVVGHSLGAPVAAQLALDHPGRVAALVLVAGSLDPGLEKVHWAQRIGQWGMVKGMLPRPLRNANDELMALEPQLEALAPRLATLRCPVLVVHGTEDPLVPFANVAFMQQAMPAAIMEVERLDGADHFLPWNARPAVTAAIAKAATMDGPAC
jgi:pimeloyl-ACP methyl ester carboxylesterase